MFVISSQPPHKKRIIRPLKYCRLIEVTLVGIFLRIVKFICCRISFNYFKTSKITFDQMGERPSEIAVLCSLILMKSLILNLGFPESTAFNFE